MTTKMRLYLLAAPETDRYDVVRAFIVRAPNRRLVRGIAAARSSDEGEMVWLDSTKSTCTVLRAAGKQGVVMCDFKAG